MLQPRAQREHRSDRERVAQVGEHALVRQEDNGTRRLRGDLSQARHADRVAVPTHDTRTAHLLGGQLVGHHLVHLFLAVLVGQDDKHAAPSGLIRLRNLARELGELGAPVEDESVAHLQHGALALLEAVDLRLDGLADQPDEQREEEHAAQHEHDADDGRGDRVTVFAFTVRYEAPCGPHG